MNGLMDGLTELLSKKIATFEMLIWSLFLANKRKIPIITKTAHISQLNKKEDFIHRDENSDGPTDPLIEILGRI